jgi:hypothetical protein
MDIFKQALIQKLKFPTVKGWVSTEQLFDLHACFSREMDNNENQRPSLNYALRELSKLRKTTEVETLTNVGEDSTLSLQIEVVKAVFEYKKDLYIKQTKMSSVKKEVQEILELAKSADLEALKAKGGDALRKQAKKLLKSI